MTATMNPPLAITSPEMMAMVTPQAQTEWRNFAHGALTTFEGHRPGYEQLFADQAVIDTIIGASHKTSMLWPGWLMSAMHSRSYEIATTCHEQYDQLANMWDRTELFGATQMGELQRHAGVNARVVRGLFNTALPPTLLGNIDNGNNEAIADELLYDGWAVILMDVNGEGSQTLYPQHGNSAESNLTANGSMEDFVLHAVRHRMY